MMKKLLLKILLISSVVSCSFVDEKTKEDIDNVKQETIAEIKTAKETAVAEAKKQINLEIGNSVRNVSDNIDSLVNCAIQKIDDATDKKVKEAIDARIKTIDERLSFIATISVIAIIFGLLGFAIGLVSLLNFKNEKFKDRVVRSVTHSRRIDQFINEKIGGRNVPVKQVNINTNDIRKEIQNFIFHPSVLNKLVDALNKIKENESVSIQEVSTQVSSPSIEPVQRTRYELFARDAQTKVLSDLSTSHQKGKTIYKLILDNPDSNTAVLDICSDKDDAVGRILRLNNEDLDAICIVSRNSDNPERVVVRKQGRAERISSSEWNVVEKIEIELS